MADAVVHHAQVKSAFLALRDLSELARREALADLEEAVRVDVTSLLLHDASPRPLIRERTREDVPATLVADRPPPPLAGCLLAGRFEVQASVAEGGFGWVFRGFDRERDEAVAVKLFKSIGHLPGAAEAEAAFFREGRVLADLCHLSPHIVAWRDVGTWLHEGRSHPFLVMEWVDGPNLAQYCEQRRAAGGPFGEGVVLLAPIAQALALAHDRGVAHRDLKPDNIVCVGEPPTLKLVDFGAAKRAVERARGFESTDDHAGMITLRYSAPEQLSKALGSSGPWSDVHALALLLTELALGHHPWAGLDPVSIMDRILDAKVRPTPRRLGIKVSDAVEGVMARALAVDHHQRPRDAGVFWNALKAALAEPPRRRWLR